MQQELSTTEPSIDDSATGALAEIMGRDGEGGDVEGG